MVSLTRKSPLRYGQLTIELGEPRLCTAVTTTLPLRPTNPRYTTLPSSSMALHEMVLLLRLTRVKPFADLNAFRSEFVTLASVAGIDPTTQVEHLRGHTSLQLRQSMTYQIHTPKLDDIDGWLEMFGKLDNNQKNLEAGTQRNIAANAGQSKTDSSSNNSPTADPAYHHYWR